MPDMRDAIAQYLASGRGQRQMPQGIAKWLRGRASGADLPG